MGRPPRVVVGNVIQEEEVDEGRYYVMRLPLQHFRTIQKELNKMYGRGYKFVSSHIFAPADMVIIMEKTEG